MPARPRSMADPPLRRKISGDTYPSGTQFMATRGSAFSVPVAEFAKALLSRSEVGPRAQVTADQVAQLLPGTATVIYVIEDLANPVWTRKAIAGEVTVAGTVEFTAGTLGTLAENPEDPAEG